MIELRVHTKWRDRSRKIWSAAIVVVCYLIVFAGILYSITAGPK
ncbi:MAG: hypothetical protein ACOC3J_00970 [Gemmatimonadota bacterium]